MQISMHTKRAAVRQWTSYGHRNALQGLTHCWHNFHTAARLLVTNCLLLVLALLLVSLSLYLTRSTHPPASPSAQACTCKESECPAQPAAHHNSCCHSLPRCCDHRRGCCCCRWRRRRRCCCCQPGRRLLLLLVVGRLLELLGHTAGTHCLPSSTPGRLSQGPGSASHR
jgi:hypothetical protein